MQAHSPSLSSSSSSSSCSSRSSLLDSTGRPPGPGRPKEGGSAITPPAATPVSPDIEVLTRTTAPAGGPSRTSFGVPAQMPEVRIDLHGRTDAGDNGVLSPGSTRRTSHASAARTTGLLLEQGACLGSQLQQSALALRALTWGTQDVLAFIRESILMGAGTFFTFGLGQKAGAMVAQGAAGTFLPGALANATNAHGDYPVAPGPAFVQDMAALVPGAAAAGLANIAFQTLVGPLMLAMFLPNSTFKPVDAKAALPYPPRSRFRTDDVYEKAKAEVNVHRAEFVRRQGEFGLSNNTVAGSVAFAVPYGMVGALNGNVGDGIKQKLAGGTQYAVSSAASGAGGFLTGLAIAWQKWTATYRDPSSGLKLPLFTAEKGIADAPDASVFDRMIGCIPRHARQQVTTAMHAFNDGREGADMVRHFLTQWKKRSLGVLQATAPQPFLGLVGNVFLQQTPGSPALRAGVTATVAMAAITLAVMSWFQTLPRVQSEQKRTCLTPQQAQTQLQQATDQVQALELLMRDTPLEQADDHDTLTHRTDRGIALLGIAGLVKAALEQLRTVFDKDGVPGRFRGDLVRLITRAHGLADEAEQAAGELLPAEVREPAVIDDAGVEIPQEPAATVFAGAETPGPQPSIVRL